MRWFHRGPDTTYAREIGDNCGVSLLQSQSDCSRTARETGHVNEELSPGPFNLETAVALSPCCEVGIAQRIEEDVTVTVWVSAVQLVNRCYLHGLPRWCVAFPGSTAVFGVNNGERNLAEDTCAPLGLSC